MDEKQKAELAGRRLVAAYSLEDMLKRIDRIEKYTSGLSWESFAGNRMVVDAVVRNLHVVGNIARYFPEVLRESNAHIPWSRMEWYMGWAYYTDVDAGRIWNTIKQELPPLVEPLSRLMETLQTT
jgi:uncharacterized protein with HEPN domain